jgi:hypothetical protein
MVRIAWKSSLGLPVLGAALLFAGRDAAAQNPAQAPLAGALDPALSEGSVALSGISAVLPLAAVKLRLRGAPIEG